MRRKTPYILHLNGHQLDYHQQLTDKPVAVHFKLTGYTFNNLTVMVIEQMCTADSAHRKERNSYWIHIIQSLAPNGLNLDLDA